MRVDTPTTATAAWDPTSTTADWGLAPHLHALGAKFNHVWNAPLAPREHPEPKGCETL
jgi:hypothetical protein